MNDGQSGWSVEGETASLQCGGLASKLSIARPQDGVELAWNQQPLHGSKFFQIANQLTAIDHHVRGCDLVTTYRQIAGSPTMPQIYWRSLRPLRTSACGIELVISVQTDLLD